MLESTRLFKSLCLKQRSLLVLDILVVSIMSYKYGTFYACLLLCTFSCDRNVF